MYYKFTKFKTPDMELYKIKDHCIHCLMYILIHQFLFWGIKSPFLWQSVILEMFLYMPAMTHPFLQLPFVPFYSSISWMSMQSWLKCERLNCGCATLLLSFGHLRSVMSYLSLVSNETVAWFQWSHFAWSHRAWVTEPGTVGEHKSLNPRNALLPISSNSVTTMPHACHFMLQLKINRCNKPLHFQHSSLGSLH